MTDPLFPPLVQTLWKLTVVLAALVLVPAAVYWLHSLWRTATSIRRYAQDGLEAARAVEGNIAALPALDTTIGVATEVLTAAESVARKLDTIASVLEQRASGRA